MLRSGDTLVVRWADRLGRNYQDVCDTIRGPGHARARRWREHYREDHGPPLAEYLPDQGRGGGLRSGTHLLGTLKALSASSSISAERGLLLSECGRLFDHLVGHR
jgi:hypothetical protein